MKQNKLKEDEMNKNNRFNCLYNDLLLSYKLINWTINN